MTRTIIMATLLVLFLATGLGLLVASALLPAPVVTSSAAEGESIVSGFYDAANTAIASGDTAGIAAIVAPHFVDREPPLGGATGRDGLLAYLADLHRADPALRLIPRVIAVHDGLAVVQVDLEHGRNEDPPDVLVRDWSRPWGPVDVLRLSAGQISERWSQRGGLTLAWPLAQTSLTMSAPTPRVVTLARITLAPTARWRFAADGPALLLSENEDSDLRAEFTASAVPGDTQSVKLRADQPLVVPIGADSAVINLAARPARLLAVTFTVPSMPGGITPTSLPNGVELRVLAGGLATDISAGAMTLDLTRVALAQNADLTLREAEGPTLVALESGRLEVRSAATVWRRRANDGISEQVRETTLTAGDGALIRADGFTFLANTSEDVATALVLSLHTGLGEPPGSPSP